MTKRHKGLTSAPPDTQTLMQADTLPDTMPDDLPAPLRQRSAPAPDTMRGLGLNILVASVYALLMGNLGLRELTIGFLVGLLILNVFPGPLGTAQYTARIRAVGRFALFFVRELTAANVQVALMALRRDPHLTPLIVAVPLRVQTETMQTLLAATITLMPGTVAMGFNKSRTVMYAHAIGIPDPDAARESVSKVEDYLLDIVDPPLQRPKTKTKDMRAKNNKEAQT